VQEKLNKTTLDANEYEFIHAPTFKEFYLKYSEENISMMKQDVVNQLSQMLKK
jgi:hypothetical protein